MNDILMVYLIIAISLLAVAIVVYPSLQERKHQPSKSKK